MGAAITAFALLLIISIAADFRVLNALICLFKSIKNRLTRENSKEQANE